MHTAQITREARPASTTDATPAHQVWKIREAGEAAAELKVADATGEILWVWVHDDRRGEGLAYALYRQASADLGGQIFHAPETHLFDEGAAFAARVGGPRMPACASCCAHLYEDDDQGGRD